MPCSKNEAGSGSKPADARDIGMLEGSVTILGDIVAPLDEAWDAED